MTEFIKKKLQKIVCLNTNTILQSIRMFKDYDNFTHIFSNNNNNNNNNNNLNLQVLVIVMTSICAAMYACSNCTLN